MKKIIFVILFLFLCVYCASSQPWSLQNSGTTNQLNSISASYAYYAWACGNNGTVLRTTNGGDNWYNVSGNGITFVIKSVEYFFSSNLTILNFTILIMPMLPEQIVLVLTFTEQLMAVQTGLRF